MNDQSLREQQRVRVNRATMQRVQRRLADVLAGAVLGALVFMTVRALGFFTALHWYEFEAFWPFLIVGALLYATPLRPLLWTVAALLAITVGVAALTPLIARPARSLVRSDTSVGRVDAVAILSSGLNDDALVSHDAVDRLLGGLAFARQRRDAADTTGIPVVLTVVTRGTEARTSSAVDQRRILELVGSPDAVHWTEPVKSTREEARAVLALARAEGWDTVAVVTSPLHTRRACATFERTGLTVRCVPVESRDLAIRTLRSPRDRLRAFQLWFYESVGTLYYRLRGWI